MRKLKIIIALLILAVPMSVFATDKENKELLGKIKTQKKDEKIKSIYMLGGNGIKATQKSAMELIPLLDDEDYEVRAATATALGDMKWEAKRAVPKLLDMMHKNNADSYAAARALISIGSVAGREEAEKFLKQRKIK